MASEIFKRIDTSHFVNSLSSDATHAGISTFEMSLGIDTSASGDSKHERALKVIKKVLAHPDTDVLIIEMLDQLYVQNSHARRDDNKTYWLLKSKVLDPRGVQITDDGFVLPDGRGLDQLERTVEPEESEPSTAGAAPAADAFGQIFGASSTPWAKPTPHYAASIPTLTATTAADPSAAQRSKNKVFVVHGRDMRPVEALKKYLLFLGLHMMPWPEAAELTGKSQPHTYDIVKAGMDNAAAIIVIFSPDDLARVKDEFSSADDSDRVPQGQARQNVTLEAGMAYALAPERTIFLKSAATRDISDIAGFNWVKLDGRWDSRSDLEKRLRNAGAAVSPAGSNLADDLAGPFRVT